MRRVVIFCQFALFMSLCALAGVAISSGQGPQSPGATGTIAMSSPETQAWIQQFKSRYPDLVISSVEVYKKGPTATTVPTFYYEFSAEVFCSKECRVNSRQFPAQTRLHLQGSRDWQQPPDKPDLLTRVEVKASSPSPSAPIQTQSLATPNREWPLVVGSQKCRLSTEGKLEQKKFSIRLTCQQTSQLLWSWDGKLWDEPRLELEQVGDFDHDGRLDLVLELSPKYSYSDRRLFLSSKAEAGSLVGVAAKGHDVDEYFLRQEKKAPDGPSQMAEGFLLNVAACLEKRDSSCLANHVEDRFYYPEAAAFGCSGLSKNYEISAEDFSKCVMTAAKVHEDLHLTLYQAMKKCFPTTPKLLSIEQVRQGLSFNLDQGLMCDIEVDKSGQPRLRGVLLGE